MGQHWQIVNLDRRGTTEYIAKLGEFYADFTPDLTCFTRWKYKEEFFYKMRGVFESVVPQHPLPDSRCKILRLPAKILTMIVKNIDNIADVMCFSFADSCFLSIGFDRMVEMQIKHITAYVGTRLICIGSYARDSDYPESIAPFVKQEIEDFIKDHGDDINNEYDGNIENRRLFPRLASTTYDPNWVLDVEPIISLAEERELRERILATAPKNYVFERAFLNMLWPERWDEVKMPLALCNLSKRQYVREAAIEDLVSALHARKDKNSTEKDYGPTPTLWQALLFQICWSSDPWVSMSCTHDVHRGAWAGDRFEVNYLDELEKAEDFADWVDVSEEVVCILDDIWENDRGW